MKFKTARDRFMINLWTWSLLSINAIFIVPFIFMPITTIDLLVVLLIDLIVSGILIWLAIDIRYELREDSLFVKGGPFRSKILYSDITKITNKPNILVGYRILFSRDTIEIHYKTGFMGSVVISPANKELFLEEIVQRNRNIQIEE